MTALFFLGFPIVSGILSIGIWYRFAWMWYLGWVMLYLFAGYLGNGFYSALILSMDGKSMFFATISYAGGLVLWLPVSVWWAGKKPEFRRRIFSKAGDGF